jgi:uncharacterized delta-60 repeat protein
MGGNRIPYSEPPDSIFRQHAICSCDRMMERLQADRRWQLSNNSTCDAAKVTGWGVAPGGASWLVWGFLFVILGWNWCCLSLPAQPGSVDTSFQPGGGNNSGLDSDVFAIAVQGDGRIIVGGSFTKVGRTSRSGIARLHSDGSLDTSFDPGTGLNGMVESLVLLPDGRLVLAGRFTMVNGQEQRYVARLLNDGKLDATFRPVLNDIAVAIAYGGENSVLIGGAFTTLDALNRRYIARIRSDGTADHDFNPGLGPDKSVHSIARQADGRLILAGQFTAVQNVPRMRIARLLVDGSLDTAFDPGAGPNHVVTTTSLQADGRVLLGGWFTNVAGATRTFLARLNADGSLDQSFTPGIALAWGGVMSIQADPAGGVIVGGEFEKIDGLSRVGIARLLENGALDVNFNPGSGVANSDGWSPLVRSVMLQADGKVLIGGRFTSVNGTKLNRLARLHGHAGGAVELVSSPQIMSQSANPDTIRLRRFGALDAAVSVNLEVTGVSASPAVLIQLPDHTVTFAAGEIEQVVRIDFLHDGKLTGGDELLLALANPIGGVLLGAQRTATVVVVQDSILPLVLEFTAVERLNAEQVRLVLSAPTGTTCILEHAAKPVGGAWTSMATNLASGNVCVFDVNSGVGNGESFYRAFASTTTTP